MSTELIFTDNPGAIPATYTRGPSDEFRLSSVLARVDGSGAAGSFLPCLSVYSQDGKLMARVPTDVALAAGDTATVTWAPFLRSSGGGSTPGVVTGATAYLWGVFGGQSVVTTPGSTRVQWAHFQTNDTSIFGTDTTAVAFPGPYHNTTGDSFLYFNAFGSYVCAGMAQLAAGVYAQQALVNNDGAQWLLDQDGPSTSTEETIATNTDAFGTAGALAVRSHRLFYLDATTTPGIVSLLCTQNSGANKALAHVSLGLIYGDGGQGTLAQIY